MRPKAVKPRFVHSSTISDSITTPLSDCTSRWKSVNNRKRRIKLPAGQVCCYSNASEKDPASTELERSQGAESWMANNKIGAVLWLGYCGATNSISMKKSPSVLVSSFSLNCALPYRGFHVLSLESGSLIPFLRRFLTRHQRNADHSEINMDHTKRDNIRIRIADLAALPLPLAPGCC
ncbi:hypothetical protein EJ08DRAFT_124131 [Tothia fuscella]|uniref:Uncharacterized protein n=1 Tax=Tothia fuscella TaxID=1048955 RepID=A0A9P4U141_9PEZI|nr:hypothetical protein EJ08DRAFT_124131 [Tothia fuscella]